MESAGLGWPNRSPSAEHGRTARIEYDLPFLKRQVQVSLFVTLRRVLLISSGIFFFAALAAWCWPPVHQAHSPPVGAAGGSPPAI